MKTDTKKFAKVSEYIEAGGMSLGLFLMESPVDETEKALAFSVEKFNRAGNAYTGKAWFPKSQLRRVENDFYANGPAEMYLAPQWLMERNGIS